MSPRCSWIPIHHPEALLFLRNQQIHSQILHGGLLKQGYLFRVMISGSDLEKSEKDSSYSEQWHWSNI